ncbi:uncharacterized protein A4U43_C01F22530 [Asparagus officinalis]|uniref:Pectate lyase n=1 Tax=Asparagus officinalis TaxID=4686 RepID=A0A5P1FRB6_ASPOF|nr:uncharacterized protein A4U43_C01F22530 [Asparagus officinalis]
MSKNKTEGRRGLGSGSGSGSVLMKSSCKATNPIDRCWRCRADWAENRQRLAGCAKGFGRKAYGGGKKSKIYVVTDSSDENLEDPKPGTLRWGVIQDDPLWIIFAEDMVITLQQELIVASWKTIDGRGAKVEIAHGAGITIQYVTNVLIHGIHIHDIVVGSGGTIRDSLKHLGLRTQSDGDAITVAFNHFGKKLTQRLPRARFGFVHIVNNDYTEWEMYAVTKRDYAAEWQWKSWNWTSEGDLFENGAYFVASGTDRSIDLTRNFSRFDVFRAKPGTFVTRLTRYAGALDCKVGEPC